MSRLSPEDCKHIVEMARERGRFAPEAYLFVFHALKYAQEELGFGTTGASGPPPAASASSEATAAREGEPSGEEVAAETLVERHITGQQLCEAMRQLALREFGYMAQTVLKCWGITQTTDFGEMVYHLIELGLMKKTDRDRREDFNGVFEFDAGLSQGFRIEVPEPEEE
jgi:uncharacterized repeat protein (TIGR04138 family)